MSVSGQQCLPDCGEGEYKKILLNTGGREGGDVLPPEDLRQLCTNILNGLAVVNYVSFDSDTIGKRIWTIISVSRI